MPLGFQDNPGNILGTDSANNLFASTNVVGNADGSMIERQEYAQTQLATLLALGPEAIKKTSIADGTTVPNNAQAAAGLLATATGGAVLITDIIVQRGATNFAGATNYEFTTDNVNGLTGAAAPNVVMIAAKFAANKTSVASLDGTTKQVPFVLESGKKLYIHGDDGATSAGVATDFYILYKGLAAGAVLA
jgi:hypothetical protein